MNYFIHYNKLIEKAKQRTFIEGISENHHIIPRCMGGTDDSENLIRLTPEEHYLAHLLLAKMYPKIPGLWFAIVMMCSSKPGRMNNKGYAFVRRKANEYLPTALQDGWAKKFGFSSYLEQSKILCELYLSGSNTTESIAHAYKISGYNVRKSIRNWVTLNGLEEELKTADFNYKSKAQSVGRRNFTKEQEERRIAAVKNMDYAARSKKTGPRDGINNPVFGKRWTHTKMMCPHCEKIVGGKRWHFENCREKDEKSSNKIYQI